MSRVLLINASSRRQGTTTALVTHLLIGDRDDAFELDVRPFHTREQTALLSEVAVPRDTLDYDRIHGGGAPMPPGVAISSTISRRIRSPRRENVTALMNGRGSGN